MCTNNVGPTCQSPGCGKKCQEVHVVPFEKPFCTFLLPFFMLNKHLQHLLQLVGWLCVMCTFCVVPYVYPYVYLLCTPMCTFCVVLYVYLLCCTLCIPSMYPYASHLVVPTCLWPRASGTLVTLLLKRQRAKRPSDQMTNWRMAELAILAREKVPKTSHDRDSYLSRTPVSSII